MFNLQCRNTELNYTQNNNKNVTVSKETLNTENCYAECTVVILSVPFLIVMLSCVSH